MSAFEQALDIDPEYAPAWIGLNVAYQEQSKYGWQPSEQAYELSIAATERALDIDPNMAEAWASVAYLKRSQWDWDGAKTAIDKALMLEPNNMFVVGTAATLAGTFGQTEKSVDLFEQVVRADPLSQSSLRALATRYGYVGRFDQAIETFERLLSLNPNLPGVYGGIGAAYLFKGDAERALIELARGQPHPIRDSLRARVLSTLGEEAQAQAIINEFLDTSAHEFPVVMAATYAWRGENGAIRGKTGPAGILESHTA